MADNVADLVAAAADGDPRRSAIVEVDGASASWVELEARVGRFAGGLSERGLQPGDRVAVRLPNSIDFAVAVWGVLRAGGTVVPVNPAYTAVERDHILGDAGAGLLVTTADAGPPPEGVTQVTVSSVRGRHVESPPSGGDELAVICYTSGTTGRPKGALLSHANLLANLAALDRLPRLRLHDEDVLLGLLPFFHIFGLNVVLNAAARNRAAVLAIDRFSPRTTAESLHRHGVTVAYGAPPVFAALLAVGADLPGLRAAVSGADALPVRTWERFADRHGLEILEGYGLTETAPVLASNAGAPAVRPGTVGVPLPGVQLRLVSAGGRRVTGEAVGEIHARGPNVFSGYHKRPAETAEVLRDGWFATGDLGSLDADGYLTIAGRLKEMIIVSGFNVYPREVEHALLTHPDVAEAAVVGVPDERTGERVRATVVLRPGARTGAEPLLDHARGSLARYKLPRDLRIVDALPRLATGKVAREALRD